MQLDGWRDKSLNGQYPSRTNMKDVSCWRRLQTEYLKKKTKSLLMAAQDQTLATNAYRVTILKRQGSKKCRMCNDRDEAVMYILSECSKLAQTEYKNCHDKVATMVQLWFTGNYAASMVLNLPNTGMNTENTKRKIL